MTTSPGLTSSHWALTAEDEVLDTTVASILHDAACAAPGAVAVVEGAGSFSERRRFSYGDLFGSVVATAVGLSSSFRRGERLATFAESTPEALVLSYAAAMAGLVLVPVNPSLRAPELAYILGQSGAAGLAVGARHRGADLAETAVAAVALAHGAQDAPGPAAQVARVDELVDLRAGHETSDGAAPRLPVELLARAPSPGDTAQLVYTSGTTGLPKGAMLTHRGMTNAARLGGIRFGLTRGDVYVDTMPLHHVGGQVVAFQICQRTATAVLVAAFDAGRVLELLESEEADVTAGVPTMLVSMIEHPDFARRDLSSLRSVSSGGAVVPPEIVRYIEESLGARSTICFGQTEMCGFISQTHLDDSPEDKAVTLGQPLPHVEARVVTPAGTAGIGETGELEVRSPWVMSGYHEMPEATREALSGDGWLRTGDLVTMDARGYLRIAGRVKEMIVTGGVNVFPVEVEAVLCEHPDVSMAAVIGIPDHKWGERVVAVVRPVPGAHPDPSELDLYVRERLAPFKAPKSVVVRNELPLTASGKVQKFVLRDELAGGI